MFEILVNNAASFLRTNQRDHARSRASQVRELIHGHFTDIAEKDAIMRPGMLTSSRELLGKWSGPIVLVVFQCRSFIKWPR